MGAVGRIVGFALGFLIVTGIATAINLLYRGVWLPMLLIAALGLLLAWHPRLSKAPASGWFVAVFGFGELYVWMRATGPAISDPEKLFSKLAETLPAVVLASGIFCLAFLIERNARAAPQLRLSWVAAIFIYLVGWGIAYFSDGKGGADPMIAALMDRFQLDESTARTLVVAIRKALHFLVYGCLALAALRLANPRHHRNTAIAFGLLIALSFALFDELRQATATNRTGSAWDIGLDMLGATTFIGVSVLRYGRRTQRNSAPSRLPS